jgi:hypothetical protein
MVTCAATGSAILSRWRLSHRFLVCIMGDCCSINIDMPLSEVHSEDSCI